MESCSEGNSEFESQADAADALPPGKSDYTRHDRDCDDIHVGVKLELESAQLEVEAAAAMRRAAEAKRRAAELLLPKGGIGRETVSLPFKITEDASSRIPVAGSGVLAQECRESTVELRSPRKSEGDLGNIDLLLNKLELPRCEIPYFDGSPIQFVPFFRQFDDRITSRVTDNGQRLNYLFHYCQGKAKEAIRGCLFYSAEEGYKRARKILEERFGQRHILVRALLEGVTSSELLQPNPDVLSDYADKLVNCADALEQLGYFADLNSVTTIESVLRKLPRFMTVDWVKRTEKIYQSNREPSFRDLCEFVSAKARLQRNRYSYLLRDQRPVAESNIKGVLHKKTFALLSRNDDCVRCGLRHSLDNCQEFGSLSVPDRWKLVSERKLCFKCLRFGHRVDRCRFMASCDKIGCNRMHHAMLHQDKEVQRVHNASCQLVSKGYGVSLGIIPVVVEGPTGSIITHALLDSGADTSLIRQDVAEKVGLKGKPEDICMNTPLGNKLRNCVNVTFRVRSLEGAEAVDIQSAYTVASVLEVPVSAPNVETLSRWDHLKGIEFPSVRNSVVGILIGLNVPEAHWILDQRRGRKGDPYADLTPLGWVLRGPVDHSHGNNKHVFTVHASLWKIEENLRRFYDHEFTDCFSSDLSLSVEDERALCMVESSTRKQNGHLCVGLPWRDNDLSKACNRQCALKRLISLGRKFRTDLNLRDRYSAVIGRYLEKGYAIKARPGQDEEEGVKWYLPHHAVLNPKKPDKLRVVFDCAAVYLGESLNKHLLQGPNMVSSLVGVLLRFRQKPVAVTADIEDMFLQVKVPESDQTALRFLWWSRGDPGRQIEEYRLTVHPFGAVSSPFCANFALRKTAKLFGQDFPASISKVVENSFYVDDLLVSVNDKTEATVMVDGLSRLLRRSGFRLTKWASNLRDVLAQIPTDERSNSVKELSDGNLPTEKALGLAWDMESDSFLYQVEIKGCPPTRRSLLSRLAAVYDPLGLISPFILPLKLWFQDLCREQRGWDEPFEHAEDKWKQCSSVLEKLKYIKLPRWYSFGAADRESEVELHVFSDASERGYGAAAYFRFVGVRTPSRCALVMAKSRVAPLKFLTIPRLELAAAVLASQIARIILREIEIPIRQVVYWSDSSSVLYYIRNDRSRFSIFVANRVNKIKEVSTAQQWRYIPGKDNPADLASRGIRPYNSDETIWFYGPKFLEKSGNIEGDNSLYPVPPKDVLEIKTETYIASVTHTSSRLYFEKFSSWFSLTKWVAWMLRFKQYLIIVGKGQANMSLRVGPLTVQELRVSRDTIVRLVQEECFAEELQVLREETRPSLRPLMNSSVKKLNPILIDGLLRVGGRLQWSDMSESLKHPVILPAKHHVTELIIRYHHEFDGHVGCNQVLASIRKRFWILQGRAAIRRIVGKCIQCRRETVRPGYQQMAPLPFERVVHGGHAFAHVGVDFFGPVYIKKGRSEQKRYGCLFTCLNIRAVHIEVTHSLSSDAFLQALIRFIARRGKPQVIFSDNATNFKGAYNELRVCLKIASEGNTKEFLLEREIEWRFSPPETSHWGGVWERMIRSVRRILRAITHGHSITDETLLTFLAEVERILNDRPLVPLSDDSKDLDALTPNKLLLLRDNPTPMDVFDFPGTCVRFWRRVQLLANTFWKRWKAEYMCMLQERQRWFRKTQSFKVGDLVLVADERVHRNQWPLGIICEVFPGTDGLVREMLVRTSRNVMRRDVRRLCHLESAV